MSTTEYLAIEQTRLVRSNEMGLGSVVVQYQPQLVKVHAVASNEGEPAEFTMCSKIRVRAEDLPGAQLFDLVALVVRCGDCADALHLPWVA